MACTFRSMAAVAFGLAAAGYALAATPEICSRDGGRYIGDCPKTCRQACEDLNFNRTNAIAQQCDKILSASAQRRGDAAVCAPAARVAPSAPPQGGAVIVQGRTPEAAKAAEECRSQFPGGGTVITSLLPPLPACLGTFPRMNCRLGRIAERGRAVAKTVERIRSRNYGTIVGASMCKIKQSEVEADYLAAEAVARPLSELTEDFKFELNCLEEVRNALLSRTCSEGDNICDKRNQAMRDILNNDFKTNIDVAGDVQTSLADAEKAITDIRRLWGDYEVICL